MSSGHGSVVPLFSASMLNVTELALSSGMSPRDESLGPPLPAVFVAPAAIATSTGPSLERERSAFPIGANGAPSEQYATLVSSFMLSGDAPWCTTTPRMSLNPPLVRARVFHPSSNRNGTSQRDRYSGSRCAQMVPISPRSRRA